MKPAAYFEHHRRMTAIDCAIAFSRQPELAEFVVKNPELFTRVDYGGGAVLEYVPPAAGS